MTTDQLPQLRMVWPPSRLSHPLQSNLPAGYSIRGYRPTDKIDFFALMALVGWHGWDDDSLSYSLQKIIPEGWFVIVHQDRGELAATAMSLHNYTARYPFHGDIGWVAVHPAHRGKGLGFVVSAVATTRLIEAGYRNIQLFTEHFRLPAIKTYLKLGYLPSLVRGDATSFDLWKKICGQLDWPFEPADWQKELEA